MPQISRRSCPAASAATAIEPLVPLADRRDRGPGRVQPAKAGRQPADGETGQVADPAARAPSAGAAVLPPRNSSGPPSRWRAPTRSAAIDERVPAALPVRGEGLSRDGDHLVARRGPRRLHPVPAPPRPRHAGRAVERALPERPELPVVADGNPLLILRHRADAAEAVLEAELRVARRRDQPPERRLLDGRRVAPHAGHLAAPPPRVPVEQRRRRAAIIGSRSREPRGPLARETRPLEPVRHHAVERLRPLHHGHVAAAGEEPELATPR